jgi:hypothetical protein
MDISGDGGVTKRIIRPGYGFQVGATSSSLDYQPWQEKSRLYKERELPESSHCV